MTNTQFLCPNVKYLSTNFKDSRMKDLIFKKCKIFNKQLEIKTISNSCLIFLVYWDTLSMSYFPCLLGHLVDMIIDFKMDFLLLQGRTEIIAGVMGGVLLVSLVITLSVYRKWKVEQASYILFNWIFFFYVMLKMVESKGDNFKSFFGEFQNICRLK